MHLVCTQKARWPALPIARVGSTNIRQPALRVPRCGLLRIAHVIPGARPPLAYAQIHAQLLARMFSSVGPARRARHGFHAPRRIKQNVLLALEPGGQRIEVDLLQIVGAAGSSRKSEVGILRSALILGDDVLVERAQLLAVEPIRQGVIRGAPTDQHIVPVAICQRCHYRSTAGR